MTIVSNETQCNEETESMVINDAKKLNTMMRLNKARVAQKKLCEELEMLTTGCREIVTETAVVEEMVTITGVEVINK